MQANVKNFTTSSETTSTASNLLEQAGVDASNQQLTEALQKAKEMTDLKDFYAIGLWGYCEGNIKDGNFNTTFCSNPEPMFWFNPFKAADIPDAEVKQMLPNDAQKTMDIYKKVSKWMFIAYVIAFVATAVELLVGIFAICSRWGSCVTTLISSVRSFPLKRPPDDANQRRCLFCSPSPRQLLPPRSTPPSTPLSSPA